MGCLLEVLNVTGFFDLFVFVWCCDSSVEFEFDAFQDAYGFVDVEVSKGIDLLEYLRHNIV